MTQFKDISPVQQDQFHQGLSQLRTRRNRMRLYFVLSVMVTCLSLVAVIFNQQFVYALFEISPTVQHLYIPAAAEHIQHQIGEQTDYFGNLLSWLFWLLMKPFVAFIAAFIIIIYVKRWQFFKTRLKTFGQKFLGWVISFILVWSGLAWLQTEIVDKEDAKGQYADVVQYQDNIQQSRMYFYIQRNHLAEPINDYLLAQTALLREPADLSAAKHYVGKLIQHEKNHPHLIEQYDLRAEQLWVMQQQVYGKAVTPVAQAVQDNMPWVNRVMQISYIIFMVVLVIFTFFSIIFYLLARQFTQRLERISLRLQE